MRDKLAIHGGNKTVTADEPHFIWPRITERTKEAVLKQLEESISIYDRSGIIAQLEDKLRKYHHKKHALLTNSGTSALHSLYVGANINEGDEVIVPAYTFYATVTPLFFTGGIPILADCDKNGNIDPQDVLKKITSRTKGIMVTHMWGIPANMDELKELAERNSLLLFEDGSHAHGATYHGQLVGSLSDIAAFSLQGQKTLTGGEGGFVVTDKDEYFDRALLLGHYNKRCKTEIDSESPLLKYAITGMGLKFRIHPLAAAIANEQFDNLETILEGRRKTAERMLKFFDNLPGVSIPELKEGIVPSWYALVLQYHPEELDGLSIDKFYSALHAEGCSELDRPGSTCPLNLHPLFQEPSMLFPRYKRELSYKKGDFPQAENFHLNALKLPVWDALSDDRIVTMYLNAFEKVVTNYKEI